MADKKRAKPRCFLILPHREEMRKVRDAVLAAARDTGIEVVYAESVILQRPIADAFASEIARADMIVADISDASANAFYELGLAHAMGKPSLVLCEAAAQGAQSAPLIPSDISDTPVVTYEMSSAGLNDLQKKLRSSFTQLRSMPARLRGARRLGSPTPRFIVDWTRIEPREFENLCLELLIQLGFRNVDWGKRMPDVDAIGFVPKQDPDGHEYREVWLVSMGTQTPPTTILDRVQNDPYFFRELGARVGTREFAMGDTPESPVTILLINYPHQPSLFPEDEANFARRARKALRTNMPIRVRVWDTQYLTHIISQYPQIGYKYFSEEARSVSRYRKTPEEMYNEISSLNARLRATISSLEQERSMRIRAERDAVWKDLSFTAAHKLGNPVFALETYLGPLARRIPSEFGDAHDVLNRMSNSVEEAKAIIQQFKSLTRAQEVSLAPVDIGPIIGSACDVADSDGVEVHVDVPEHLPLVIGDGARLVECFNELVANAYHWFDKEPKRLTISARTAMTRAEVPEQLPVRPYVVVRFSDNGVGIPAESKERIFDAFYTTYHHGTGLGLSLVRRILEGHDGLIREVGSLGEGAAFEIFLPSVQDSHSTTKRPTVA